MMSDFPISTVVVRKWAINILIAINDVPGATDMAVLDLPWREPLLRIAYTTMIDERALVQPWYHRITTIGDLLGHAKEICNLDGTTENHYL